LGSAAAQVLIHPFPVNTRQAHRKQHPFGRCFGVDFTAHPVINKGELFLQRFDNTFADITERSDVVGENANVNAHGTSSIE